MILTQEELKQLLFYDSDTGIFTYRISTNPRNWTGKIAGTVQKEGHLYLQLRGKRYQLHQLAFLYVKGYLPKEVDHINGNSADNRWINLRECTRRQNSYNSCLRSDNTSGVKGISRRGNIWRVRLYVEGKERFIGNFKSFEEAIKQNKIARTKYHGEFTNV